MKDSFYFSHDSNARSDEKMIRIRARHGAKGYGIYFMIVEMLREAKCYQLLNDCLTIAYELKESEEDVRDIIENYGLFEFTEDNYFYSDSLKKRMEKREEISKKRAEQGKKGGLAKASNLLKQKSSKHLALKERKGKEIKGKENIINQASPRVLFKKPSIEECKEEFASKGFADHHAVRFWNFYESKDWHVGKNKMKKWKAAAANWLSDKTPDRTETTHEHGRITYT